MAAFRWLILALAWVASGLFAGAGAMLTYEVVARYFLNAPTIWAAELSQMSLIWGSLIAMPWALSARRHIAVDSVVRLLPVLAQRLCEVLAMAVVAAFSAVAGVFGFQIFWDSFERGRTTGSMLDLPIWITELAVPVGFGLLFLQAIAEIFRAWRGEMLGIEGEHG